MNFFKNLLKSSYSKNVITLMTGNIIAQAIPIAITPILTRLYTPYDFGILALIMSLIAVLGVIANGKYEQAIMLPKKEIDSLSLVYLSVLISSLFAIFLLLVILFFKKQIAYVLGEPTIEIWLFFVPVLVFMVGIFNSLKLYRVRNKSFKQVSISLVSKSSGLAIAQLSIGILKSGVFGLIMGQLASYIAGVSSLIMSSTNKVSIKKTFDIALIKELAKKHQRFPKFSLPSSLLNSISLNSINFLIVAFFTTSILGFYTIARKLLSLPSVIIGESINQVYFQKLSEIKNERGNVLQVFNDYIRRLILISLPIFALAYFTVEPLFTFFLGSDWSIAGQFAKILVPLACIRLVSSTLSSTLLVFQKQNYTLLIQTIQFITLVVIFWLSYIWNFEFMETLVLYTTILSIEYILIVFVYWYVVKKHA